MRFFFGSFLYLTTILGGSTLQEFPSSTKEITQFTNFAFKDFDQELTLFTKQSLDNLSFTSVVTEWNNAIELLFNKGVVLSFLPLTTQDPRLIEEGNVELKKLQEKLWVAMNDEKALSIFLSFAKNQTALDPYQRYIVYQMLQTAENTPLKEEVLLIQKTLSSYPMQPFVYTQGLTAEKTLPSDKKMTVLSWNVCLLESNISMLFGGVLPWQARIDRIAEKIEQLNPDIICLQEVFSSAAGDVLVKKLQSSYSHFYYKMGPHPAGFSIEQLGIPGGLFVASKYPLKNPIFTSYNKEETPPCRSYGFFSADIYEKNKLLARLITTHLQPGNEGVDKEYRAKQLKSINSTLQREIPTFLCGDFNIVKDSAEGKASFSSYNPSSYEGVSWTCCELRDYWWKAKESVSSFHALPPNKEWLDYFFCAKTSSKTPTFSTQVIMVNDLSSPQNALSDHQALLTALTFESP